MEKEHKNKYFFLMASVLIILLFIPFSVQRMDSAVLESAYRTGKENARSYALNEMLISRQYETVLDTLEYQLRPENRADNYNVLIRRYPEFVAASMELEDFAVYASLGGKIYGASYPEDGEAFDASRRDWYQDALKADGKIIYTDVYRDAKLKKDVVTLAKKIEGTQDVAAMDLYPDGEEDYKRGGDMPEGTDYFLCDSNGTLIMYTIKGARREKLQEEFDSIFEGISEGRFETYDTSIVGADHVKRGVYYYRTAPGWYAVVTVPYSSLLEPYNRPRHIFLVVIGIFLVTAASFAIADYRVNRKARTYNEIIGVLGNSYYALYQVDLKKDRYFMLKGSDYVKNGMPRRGPYGKLLDFFRELISESDYREFKKTFSTENMKKLVRQRTRDFGGDFRRLFNGEYRWVHVQMLYDESLRRGTVVLAFRDVNEAKAQELSRLELLKNSLDLADSMAKAKSRFFSQMSHDMRTPLSGIIGLAQLAGQQTDDSIKTADSLKKIESLGNQLLELINDILDISQIGEGKLELKRERFRIKEKLEELASLFGAQLINRRKYLHADIEVEDIYIVGDWGKLQQILNNLLSNAIKFTGENGIIEFKVREYKDHNSRYRKYLFFVMDNGAGMSEAFLDRLFLPFEREVQFGAANVSGTGLGMSIVHELVQEMGGTIKVESELGKGTAFEVMIPCRTDAEKGTERAEKKTPTDGRGVTLEGRRVLAADDNEINMEIMSEALRTFGMEIVQAWNGREAVELYESHEAGYFDLILMDMQMPVMDGCEAAEHIRKIQKADAATVPIIAVTASTFAEDVALTKKAGMDGHISKPIDFRLLREIMEQVLSEENGEA